MEYTINNNNGLSVTLSKIEGDENVFVANVESATYQYGINADSQKYVFFEPVGGPRISVGSNLQEYGEGLPNLVINYIGAGEGILVLKAEEPQTEDSAEAEQEE